MTYNLKILTFITGAFIISMWSNVLMAQVTFMNSGLDLTLSPGALLYIDGDLYNDNAGLIHNNGDIFLTGNWSNDEPNGGLGPISGKVTLYGNNQDINGQNPTTFNDLDCSGTGTKTLYVNTIVGGNTGVLSLNASKVDLNSNTLIITNPLPVLSRTSGYIISETEPSAGYGKIQWNIGSGITGDNYIFPLGTLTGEYIPLILKIKTPGTDSINGNISVATYPTETLDDPNNRPLPLGINNLNDNLNNSEYASFCLDRFWITDAPGYSANPVVDLTFTYQDISWEGGNNTITEDSLAPFKWNGFAWETFQPNINNSALNIATALNVNDYTSWTLTSKDPVYCGNVFIPTIFSPNNDGLNDVHCVLGACVKEIYIAIFDRWGEKVFESNSYNACWDGSYKGNKLNDGVFVYYLKALLENNETVNKKGNITLIR